MKWKLNDSQFRTFTEYLLVYDINDLLTESLKVPNIGIEKNSHLLY